MGDPGSTRPYGGQVSVYDQEYREYTEDIPFYLERLRGVGGEGPLLDLGTGTGRVAIPLAQAGYRVVGLDISEPMLRHARRRRRDLPRDVAARLRFSLGDMAHFSLRERFGAALVTFSGFALVPSAEQRRACLQCCRAHLRPRGLLLIDLFAPRMLDTDDAPQPVRYSHTFWVYPWRQKVEKEVEERFDRARSLVHVRYHYRRWDSQERRVLDEYDVVFGLARLGAGEVEEALIDAGFDPPEIYGDYRGDPFGPGSERMIFETRAPG